MILKFTLTDSTIEQEEIPIEEIRTLENGVTEFSFILNSTHRTLTNKRATIKIHNSYYTLPIYKSFALNSIYKEVWEQKQKVLANNRKLRERLKVIESEVRRLSY
jgi:hypothetical protein